MRDKKKENLTRVKIMSHEWSQDIRGRFIELNEEIYL